MKGIGCLFGGGFAFAATFITSVFIGREVATLSASKFATLGLGLAGGGVAGAVWIALVLAIGGILRETYLEYVLFPLLAIGAFIGIIGALVGIFVK